MAGKGPGKGPRCDRPGSGAWMAVDVQIRRLRLKIEADPSHPALIVTERGARYRLASDVEALY